MSVKNVLPFLSIWWHLLLGANQCEHRLFLLCWGGKDLATSCPEPTRGDPVCWGGGTGMGRLPLGTGLEGRGQGGDVPWTMTAGEALCAEQNAWEIPGGEEECGEEQGSWGHFQSIWCGDSLGMAPLPQGTAWGMLAESCQYQVLFLMLFDCDLPKNC